MTKPMAIVAMVAAVVGALLLFILSGPVVPILVMAVLIAAAVILFMERQVLFGVVVAILVLVPLLSFTPLEGDGKTFIPRVSWFTGEGSYTGAGLILLLLIPAMLLLVTRRRDLQPTWLTYVGFGMAALVLVLALVIPASDYGSLSAVGIIAAVAFLILLWPLSMMLRPGPVTASPPVEEPPATTRARTSKAVRK
jgi:hypothetical protein